MMMNLFNGDCAAAAWTEARLPGGGLVWRENYLYGELPETDDLAVFNRIRAGALHRSAPDKPEADIFAELERMHAELFALTENDVLTLWFDCCPFDRAMLARILYLLAGVTAPPQVNLILEDVVWDRAAFMAPRQNIRRLGGPDFQFGRSEWIMYRQQKRPHELFSNWISPPARPAVRENEENESKFN